MNFHYLTLMILYTDLVLLVLCLWASLDDDDATYRNPENPPPTPPRHIPLGVAFSERERIDAKRAQKIQRRVEQQKQAATQREEAAWRWDSVTKAVRECLNKLWR